MPSFLVLLIFINKKIVTNVMMARNLIVLHAILLIRIEMIFLILIVLILIIRIIHVHANLVIMILEMKLAVNVIFHGKILYYYKQ